MPVPSKRLLQVRLKYYDLGFRRCPCCCCQLVWHGPSDNCATAEHLVPVSNGGTNTWSNLIILCRKCNRSRSNTNFIDWIKTRQPPNSRWFLSKYREALEFYKEVNRSIQQDIETELKRLECICG